MRGIAFFLSRGAKGSGASLAVPAERLRAPFDAIFCNNRPGGRKAERTKKECANGDDSPHHRSDQRNRPRSFSPTRRWVRLKLHPAVGFDGLSNSGRKGHNSEPGFLDRCLCGPRHPELCLETDSANISDRVALSGRVFA